MSCGLFRCYGSSIENSSAVAQFLGIVRRGVLLALAALVVVGIGSDSVRASTLPSIAAIEALVAQSSLITHLPANLDPPLQELSSRMPWNELAGAGRCTHPEQLCRYGDAASSETIAVFGDSHAAMWAPAVVVAAERRKVRTIVLWRPQCPLTTTPIGTACTAWKAQAVRALLAARPSFVVLAERTSLPGETWASRPSRAAWAAGLTTLVTQFSIHHIKVVMVLDNPVLTSQPGRCLARFPSQVQSCSSRVSASILAATTYRSAEALAARRVGATTVDPLPWICSTTCSPVVGRWLSFYDATHVSGAYSRHLAGAFSEALAPLW